MKRLSYYDAAFAEVSLKAPDLSKVVRLLDKALAKGDYRAAYALGTWYLHGKHFQRNMRKAIKYLRLASKQNVPDALYDLAVCYETGAGVPCNLRQALALYLRAALLGEKQSTYEVGRCYYWGIGVSKDRLVARVWLDHASKLKRRGLTSRPATNEMAR